MSPPPPDQLRPFYDKDDTDCTGSLNPDCKGQVGLEATSGRLPEES